MTAPQPSGRDADQVDALVADRYLDALLAAGDRHAEDAPSDPALDADLRAAARVLRRSLVRVHPSFRFEERLARRLGDLAAARWSAGAVTAEGGDPIPFPARQATHDARATHQARATRDARAATGAAVLDSDPLLARILAGDLDPTDAAALEEAGALGLGRRPLLVGGAAITSAALSIVGVVLVAWRVSRPTVRTAAAGAMTRAARTAHARRAAAAIGGGPA